MYKPPVPGYKLVKELGGGGFSTVYEANPLESQYKVAIKAYSKIMLKDKTKLAEKIEDEIKAMSEIEHEHVLKIYQEINTNDYKFLVLEYCDGGDLTAKLMKQKAPLPEDQVKIYFFDLLQGFEALQQRGVIHRDLKPENLFLRNSKIVIGDFGVCRFGVKEAITKVGNMATIAPEVRNVDFGGTNVYYNFKVDVWSLGVTLYMLLFGRDPWNFYDAIANKPMSSHTKLDYQHHSGEQLIFPDSPKVSERVKVLLRRMITINPQMRPTFTELIKDEYFAGMKLLPIQYPPGAVEPEDGSIEYLHHQSKVAHFVKETAEMLASFDKHKPATEHLVAVAACLAQHSLHLSSAASLRMCQHHPEQQQQQEPQHEATERQQTLRVRATLSEQVLTGRVLLQQLTDRCTQRHADLLSLLRPHPTPVVAEVAETPVVLQAVRRVAHVLSQELQQHNFDTKQMEEWKALLVRIYLCLTYQQAMEFRDSEQNIFNWNDFERDMKSGFMTKFSWKETQVYLGLPSTWT